MLDGLIFDKDGTLFDFRSSWGNWAAGFVAGLAQDGAQDDAQDGAQDGAQLARLGAAIGFDLASRSFRPDSPVIAGTAAEIAAALLPHLAGWTPRRLTDHIDATAGAAPMAEAVPLRPLLAGLRAAGL